MMMHKHLVTALVIVLVSTLVPLIPTQAQDDDTIYGITTGDVDVHVGPDFAYPVIGRLPLNASVVVLGRAGDFFRTWDGRQWLQIDFGDTAAWVYARLVRTSQAFNSIFPTGMILPRDGNGRVPDGFDLNTSVCDQWQGEFTQNGDFMAGDTILTVTYPPLQGANIYSVIVISPAGYRTAFDSETTTAEISLKLLPWDAGTYTWRVAPYWTNTSYRYAWQQVCLLRTGGTFEKPDTKPQEQ
jgi:hypothetical protein